MLPTLATIAPKAWMSAHQLGPVIEALHRAQELALNEPDDSRLLEKLYGEGDSLQHL